MSVSIPVIGQSAQTAVTLDTNATANSAAQRDAQGGLTSVNNISTGNLQTDGTFTGEPTALQTANFSFGAATHVFVDCTSNTVAGALPSPVGITGRVYWVWVQNNGTNAATFTTTGGSVIGTSSTTTPNKWLQAVSNGVNWYVG